mmetsp:Transcript_10748/g.31104  ORF Transcript_10748/g.31104 Transcript_10748/m.31104 type:complete len:81 (-) Transcript_10748:493-735(-)
MDGWMLVCLVAFFRLAAFEPQTTRQVLFIKHHYLCLHSSHPESGSAQQRSLHNALYKYLVSPTHAHLPPSLPGISQPVGS